MARAGTVFWNVLNGGGFRELNGTLRLLVLGLLLTYDIQRQRAENAGLLLYLLTKSPRLGVLSLARLRLARPCRPRCARPMGGGLTPPPERYAPAGESCERAGGGGCDETGRDSKT